MYETWKKEGLPGALYSVSSSGWMEGANFELLGTSSTVLVLLGAHFVTD